MADEVVSRSCCENNRVACEKLMEAKFESISHATKLAAEVLSERLKSLNELREMATARDKTFVHVTTFEAQVKEIESLRLSRASLEGKASQSSVNVSYLISALTLIVAVVLHFVK
jgi:hypothetical protein